MRFVFLSGPECGDVDECRMFGLVFSRGVAVQVGDAQAIAKLAGNRFFAAAAGEVASEPPRRGRPRKAT